MSNTITDMAKVTQMLDNGWRVELEKSEMGSYLARGTHNSIATWERARNRLVEQAIKYRASQSEAENLIDMDLGEPGAIDTDDFTPEQALTRLAYKVHGEVI